MQDHAEPEGVGLPDSHDSAPVPVQGRPVKQRGGFLEYLGELPLLIISAIVLAWVIKSFVAQPFVIPSQSMAETLVPGDRVVVTKVSYRLKDPLPGEVIVFQAPERSGMSDQDFIKRIVARSGDEVEVRGGRLFINGRRMRESYVVLPDTPDSQFGPETVPENAYFVMGDNRSNSKDSRYFGAVSRERIRGKAIAIYWPPQRAGLLK